MNDAGKVASLSMTPRGKTFKIDCVNMHDQKALAADATRARAGLTFHAVSQSDALPVDCKPQQQLSPQRTRSTQTKGEGRDETKALFCVTFESFTVKAVVFDWTCHAKQTSNIQTLFNNRPSCRP